MEAGAPWPAAKVLYLLQKRGATVIDPREPTILQAGILIRRHNTVVVARAHPG